MAHKANGHNYQFYGVGKPKASRRANAPAGSKADRKYYPYATKEQVGTPMEAMINRHYDDLIHQFNAMASHPNGLRMATGESTGRLNSAWNRTAHKMTTGRSVSNYIGDHDVGMRDAKAALAKMSGFCAFGADPKSR